ncbi:MAG: AMP-binding protein [Thermomicrobiales bacterium]
MSVRRRPVARVDQTLLTPLSFLERSALALPGRIAIVHGDLHYTYKEMADAATRLARALQASGIEPGDRVAYLCPNIPEMLIAHFGVPLAHAVLVAINTRLSAGEVEYILNHSGAKILIVDTGLMATVAPNHDKLETVEEIIYIDDAGIPPAFDATSFESFIERGADDPLPWRVDDEDRIISINYTSGTTGRPKGVMYSHRGAYLNALGEVIHSHRHTTVYLWTLPMFHCNGWCTTWGVTGIGGTHICLTVEACFRPDLHQIHARNVTHLNAAPDRPDHDGEPSDAHPVENGSRGHDGRRATGARPRSISSELLGMGGRSLLRPDRDSMAPTGEREAVMRLQERIGARQAAGTPGYRLHRQRSDPVVDENERRPARRQDPRRGRDARQYRHGRLLQRP